MRPVVCLLPGLMVPLSAPNAESFERNVKGLMEASACTREDAAFVIATHDELIADLVDAGLYPAKNAVIHALKQNGLSDVYSANDISGAKNAILERAQILSDCTFVQFASVDVVECFPPPPIRDDQLSKAEQKAWGHLAVGRALDPETFVCAMEGGDLCEVAVEGRAKEILTASGQVVENLAFKEVVDRIGCTSHLYKSIDAERVWRSSEDSEQIKLAILASASRIGQLLSEDIEDLSNRFTLGSDFLSSLHRNSAIGRGPHVGVTLDACARLILGTPKEDARPIRKRLANGRYEAVTRSDGARGYRTHLTRSHEALRLMFWMKGGMIELANVGPKHELAISR